MTDARSPSWAPRLSHPRVPRRGVASLRARATRAARLRTGLLAGLVVLGLALAAPAGARAGGPASAPDELGPWDVGRTTLEMADPSRDGRELTVDVWYPVDPEDAEGALSVYQLLIFQLPSEVAFDAPPVSDERIFFPFVVFSHGNGGVRFQSLHLTETLASHGFVVAAPDHTGNTVLDLLGGSGDAADFLQSAIDRPQDVSFVIDRMLEKSFDPEDPFFLRVSPHRIGVAGHSFGGFTALATAGGLPETLPEDFDLEGPEGFDGVAPDRRVRAIAPIAPASSPLPDEVLERVRVPALLLGGTRDETTPIDPEITRPFELLSSRVLLRADLLGAGHLSFSFACELLEIALDVGLPPDFVDDLPGSGGSEGCGPDFLALDEARRITSLYSVSFFRRHLVHDGRYQRFLTESFAEREEPDVAFERRRPDLPPFFLSLLQLLFGR